MSPRQWPVNTLLSWPDNLSWDGAKAQIGDSWKATTPTFVLGPAWLRIGAATASWHSATEQVLEALERVDTEADDLPTTERCEQYLVSLFERFGIERGRKTDRTVERVWPGSAEDMTLLCASLLTCCVLARDAFVTATREQMDRWTFLGDPSDLQVPISGAHAEALQVRLQETATLAERAAKERGPYASQLEGLSTALHSLSTEIDQDERRILSVYGVSWLSNLLWFFMTTDEPFYPTSSELAVRIFLSRSTDRKRSSGPIEPLYFGQAHSDNADTFFTTVSKSYGKEITGPRRKFIKSLWATVAKQQAAYNAMSDDQRHNETNVVVPAFGALLATTFDDEIERWLLGQSKPFALVFPVLTRREDSNLPWLGVEWIVAIPKRNIGDGPRSAEPKNTYNHFVFETLGKFASVLRFKSYVAPLSRYEVMPPLLIRVNGAPMVLHNNREDIDDALGHGTETVDEDDSIVPLPSSIGSAAFSELNFLRFGYLSEMALPPWFIAYMAESLDRSHGQHDITSRRWILMGERVGDWTSRVGLLDFLMSMGRQGAAAESGSQTLGLALVKRADRERHSLLPWLGIRPVQGDMGDDGAKIIAWVRTMIE